AVRLEVVAPGLAPEGLRDLAAVDGDRLQLAAALLQLSRLRERFRAPLGDRDVLGECAVSPGPGHGRHSSSALERSRATVRRSSASLISVRRASADPSRSSPATAFFFCSTWSIFSSTVPRQTNLCTSTLRFWPMRKARSVAWSSTAGF